MRSNVGIKQRPRYERTLENRRSTLRMDEPLPSAVKTAKTAPEVEALV